ncbi:phosphotransferase family protein [Brachybacterium sp. YJGR34]|uniref:phosphotransferase family protein n=1 Tax=Brachybacterium sp. YJGR34 TaxID=2059911 RepID=UPI000E0C4848|nr:phosphotransferase [Brachybacterium sp. YJGR34]
MPVLEQSMERWGLSPADGAQPREARSPASVHHVLGRHGRAVLKVTSSAAGGAAVRAARRELAFYTEIAPGLPHVAPRLLEATEGSDGTALLIEAAGRVLPVEDWDTERWSLLAETMHQVHAATPTLHEELAPSHPLEEVLTVPDCDGSTAFWRDLSPALDEVLAAVRESVPPLLDRGAFVHGDLHLDNVLASGDDLRIVDWQQCGAGSAAADLAFVDVRLAPAGRAAPDAFLAAYAAAGGEDLSKLRRATALIELATYLLVWPPFAAYNGREGVARVRRRTADLARWALTE